jgi:adenine-specific DNA-methyltransferase
VKEHGVHYTPPELADFLARRLLAHTDAANSSLSVLDPAAGEGELLAAVAAATADSARSLALVGIDRDEVAVMRARERLASVETATADLLVGNFLTGIDELDGRSFDLIISNPPYVRTQLLGAAAARELADRFDLTGRVDLYQAFVRAMTALLRPGGMLGLLCSNRFLSVQAGAALRNLLSTEFELCEVYDLGDTKLFAAAVLPAIVIARRVEGGGAGTLCHFTRVYERADAPRVATSYPSVLVALDAEAEGAVAVREQVFEIERGELARGKPDEPWRLTHAAREAWLATVAAHTEQTFEDVAPIRVGIKTTADDVFIRDGWDDLPEEVRPESELVHPIITHHIAARWRAKDDSSGARTVLYPYVVTNGKRATVDLVRFPRASAYLESHRGRLQGRSYVIEAGRQWFEIWVPQQPADWPKRKIVFPDIAKSPQFFLDSTGGIVNGDCYWMALDDDVPAELASLVLAVGNSSFAIEFYDAVCGNRLYAGRRRFITQYVRRFPLPRLTDTARAEIHERVEMLLGLDADNPRCVELAAELDWLVWRAFGLQEEVAW